MKKMGTLEHLSQPPQAFFFLFFFSPRRTETTRLMNDENLFFSFSRTLLKLFTMRAPFSLPTLSNGLCIGGTRAVHNTERH